MNPKPVDRIVAKVVKVVPEGKHGPYAKAISQTRNVLKGDVTFSLDVTIWKEDTHPELGAIVVLEDLWKKAAGWRANVARLFRVTDSLNE